MFLYMLLFTLDSDNSRHIRGYVLISLDNYSICVRVYVSVFTG